MTYQMRTYCMALDHSRQALVELAWERGLLSYKLYDHQIPLYVAICNAIEKKGCLKYVINCARRFGKTTILCIIAIEYALRTPNRQIRFAAPTAKALRKIIRPIIKMLIQDCPEAMRPDYNTQDNVYRFKNGSEIHFAGTDNQNYESLRGTASHLNIVDEAAFCDELDYIVRSVLMPQTLTTKGTTILASTPPPTPAHDFYALAQEAMANGFYQEFSIYENKSVDKETLDLYAKESGGYESTTFKREYLVQFVVDESLAICPEWRDSYIDELPKTDIYEYLHKYVAMDLGVVDFTAAIFGTYHFPNATLYIEDEYTISGPKMTTPILAEDIKNKELELWADQKPYVRVSDNNNLLLLQDLGILHDLEFAPTSKDSLEAMVNELRIMVGSGRIKVSPRCVKLVQCLKYGVWDLRRKKFARVSHLGHFDHIAALIYLIRNLDKHTNPVPQLHNINLATHYVPRWTREQSQDARALTKAFNLR